MKVNLESGRPWSARAAWRILRDRARSVSV